MILSTRDIGVSFGKFTALRGVSAEFRRGELAGIIGPNGAGKSTFFNVLSGQFRPTTGRVTFEGGDITGLPQHRYARLGHRQVVPDHHGVPAARHAGKRARGAAGAHVALRCVATRARLTSLVEEAEVLLHTVGLWPARHRVAATLAHGEQRALEIAMALASKPRLLLLDEPTAGMSPEETRGMMDLITHLASERTVSWSSTR